MRFASSAQVRELDRLAMEESGVSGRALMGRAGRGIARRLMDWLGRDGLARRRCLVVAGRGNNGGDGFVVAEHLFRLGCPVEVWLATDPARVTGFLDVTGAWDPSLAFVMGGALGSFGITVLLTGRLRNGRGFFGSDLPAAESEPVSLRLLAGSGLFGVGWGLGGLCPGPALANLGAWRMEAVVFVVTMGLGIVIAQRLFGADS